MSGYLFWQLAIDHNMDVQFLSIFRYALSNTFCLPPKFCINYCYDCFSNAPGRTAYSLEHAKTINYAKFGGQTNCVMGDSKIVNFFGFAKKDGWKLSSSKTNMLWCNCSVHSLSEFFVTTVKVWQCNWKKACVWIWKWAWSKCNVDLFWRKIGMANYELCNLCHGWETGKCTLVSFCLRKGKKDNKIMDMLINTYL